MTTPTQALDVLAAARPDELAAPEQYIRNRIYQAAISTPEIPAAHPSPFRRRVVLSAVGAGAVAAILLVALAVQPHRTAAPAQPHVPRPVQSDSSARAVLLAAAASASVQTSDTGTGRYWFSVTQVFDAGTNGYPSSTLGLDDWIARSPNDPSWFILGKSPLAQAGSGSSDPYHTRFDVLDRFLTFAELQQLPNDPAGLEAYLLAIPPDHPNLPQVPVSERLFTACLELAEVPAQPAVRAAALRLLSGLPDLTALGRVPDPLGRIGVGISNASFGNPGQELIIDPVTGSLLGFEDVSSVDGHVVVTHYEALLESGWTNTVQPPSGAS
ncbi:MAG: CU044_5270 family protein [Candidatus Dormibacteria bacterium]